MAVLMMLLMVTDVAAAATGYDGGKKSSRRRAVSSSGRVLGASTSDVKFTVSLGFGSRGPEVVKLQERLRAEGFFTFPTSTGYFGPITRSALAAYQASKGIVPAAGFLGPITIAVLNQ